MLSIVIPGDRINNAVVGGMVVPPDHTDVTDVSPIYADLENGEFTNIFKVRIDVSFVVVDPGFITMGH